ncbi:MAG: ABC transporter ATP-binding protein [Magnetococcales bacterium]|nr:ABC transporter ATP-binding protein [Magnetococcales bacterium]NGZ28154.1 ABC transporter ATP-binding protein [Magnetococcales bacterium]
MNDWAEKDNVLLTARQVTKHFTTSAGPIQVLKGVDLTLRRGEMAALLGVSGSGKSTLLQILGTLDHPTSGQVWMDGVDMFAMDARQAAAFRNKRIGFVYQFHRLLAEFTALENAMMPLLIDRQDKKQAMAKAEQALREVGLGHRLHHKPGQLSGGEQQRVAIARAMANHPALLLADEPTGNLDRHTAQDIFNLLRKLNQETGLSCLLVTHNPELAASLDRSFHLVDGNIVE